MPGLGMMKAYMVLMGQKIREKKPLEARYSTLNALFLGGVFMGVIGIIMSIFAPLFSSFFSKDLKTIEASVRYLIPIGISQIAFAYICILDGALRGAGITKITLIVNGLMIWGIRVIPCYFIATLKYPIIYIYICIFMVSTI